MMVLFVMQQKLICLKRQTLQMYHVCVQCFVFFIACLPQKCDINSFLVSRKVRLSVMSLHPHNADETWWTTSLEPLWDVQRWALSVFELWVSDGKNDWVLTSEDNAERKYAYFVYHLVRLIIFSIKWEIFINISYQFFSFFVLQS